MQLRVKEEKREKRERKKGEHKGRQLSKGVKRKKDLNMTNDGLSMFHVKLMQRKSISIHNVVSEKKIMNKEIYVCVIQKY